jgi:hypothetical protein
MIPAARVLDGSAEARRHRLGPEALGGVPGSVREPIEIGGAERLAQRGDEPGGLVGIEEPAVLPRPQQVVGAPGVARAEHGQAAGEGLVHDQTPGVGERGEDQQPGRRVVVDQLVRRKLRHVHDRPVGLGGARLLDHRRERAAAHEEQRPVVADLLQEPLPGGEQGRDALPAPAWRPTRSDPGSRTPGGARRTAYTRARARKVVIVHSGHRRGARPERAPRGLRAPGVPSRSRPMRWRGESAAARSAAGLRS